MTRAAQIEPWASIDDVQRVVGCARTKATEIIRTQLGGFRPAGLRSWRCTWRALREYKRAQEQGRPWHADEHRSSIEKATMELLSAILRSCASRKRVHQICSGPVACCATTVPLRPMVEREGSRDMTMTVDEARLVLESLRTRHWDCLDAESREAITIIGAHQDTLAAEVERLRGECVSCSTADNWRARALLAEAEVERLQKLVADQALTIGMLRDRLARERSVDADWKTTAATLRGRLALANEDAKLRREEAQTSRLALDVALKEIETLNTAGEIGGAENQRLHALVKWFEDRDKQIERSHSWSAAGRALYEKHNPKPGAAT